LVVLSLKGIKRNTILQGTESLYAANLAVTSAERVLTDRRGPREHVSLEQRVTLDALIGLIRMIATYAQDDIRCGMWCSMQGA